MGLGFKYHVLTIAAIFFALTIGLVVGSLYASPRVPQTTIQAIEALKRAQATLDQNNRDLKLDRDQLQNVLHQTLPFALHNRLTGRSVAILQSDDNGEALTEVRNALTEAGARVLSITEIDRPFGQPNDLLVPRLNGLRSSATNAPTSRSELARAIASILKKGDNTAAPLMPILQDAGLLHFGSESNYNQPVSAVVLLSGNQSAAASVVENVDVPLISAMNEGGITVYACEPQGVVTSRFPQYRQAHLTVQTIDKVDTDPGKWQLVMALDDN